MTKEEARTKAARAIRIILRAAAELNAAEKVLLAEERTYDGKKRGKRTFQCHHPKP